MFYKFKYIDLIKEIEGIQLTYRDIDILSFLINGRSAKVTAHFLSLSVRTVENYTQNIMSKFGLHSRESIIQFMERSDKYKMLRMHNDCIRKEFYFQQQLKTLKGILSDQNETIVVHIEKGQNELEEFFMWFSYHIKFMGIKIQLKKFQENLYLENTRQVKYMVVGFLSPSYFGQVDSIRKLYERKNSGFCGLFYGKQFHQTMDTNFYLMQENIEKRYHVFFKVCGMLFSSNSFMKAYEDFDKMYESVCLSDYQQVDMFERSSSLKKNPTLYPHNIKRGFILLIFIIISVIYFSYNYSYYCPIKSSNSKNELIYSNFPRQDICFVGREKMIYLLSQYLIPANGKDEDTKIVVLSGMGGVGKTQISLRFAHLFQKEFSFSSWFSGEDVSVLEKNFRDFFGSFVLDKQKVSLGMYLKIIHKYLSENPGWLIIFDNVNNYLDIKSFLPQKGGAVIITTRQQDWPDKFLKIPINVMTETESLLMFTKIVPINDHTEHEEIKKISETLGYLPLALSQVASYIKQNKMSSSNYLKLLQEHENDLLTTPFIIDGENYNSIAATLQVSLQSIINDIKGKDLIPFEILAVCSYLSPERISKYLLLSWIKYHHPDIKSPEIALNASLDVLQKYSMIHLDRESISVHRIIQCVVRQVLSDDKKIFYKKNFIPWKKLHTYLVKFFNKHESEFKTINSFDLLIKSGEKLILQFDKPCDDQAELILVLSSIYFFQDNYQQYIELLNRAKYYIECQSKNDFLKGKLAYLYAAYYRKIGDLGRSFQEIKKEEKYLKCIENSNKFPRRDKLLLKAKIIYNKLSIFYQENKSLPLEDRNKEDLEKCVKEIDQVINIYEDIGDKREKIRAIELSGRFLYLLKKYECVIEKLYPHIMNAEAYSDIRTKRLLYTTLGEAYVGLLCDKVQETTLCILPLTCKKDMLSSKW